MIHLKHKGKKIKLINSFEDLSFSKAVQIKNIPVPDQVITLWETEETFNLNNKVANYYNQIFKILSVTKLKKDFKFELFYNSILDILKMQSCNINLICYSIYKEQPPAFNKVESFRKGFFTYDILKSRDLFNDTEPLYHLSSYELTEALNAIKGGLEAYPVLAAIIFQKRLKQYLKGTILNIPYSENRLIRQSKQFNDLPLSIIWAALHEFNYYLEYIDIRFEAINKKIKVKNPNTEFANKHSGILSIGFESWIMDVSERFKLNPNEVGNMNNYKFLELYNKIRAEANNNILMSQ